MHALLPSARGRRIQSLRAFRRAAFKGRGSRIRNTQHMIEERGLNIASLWLKMPRSMEEMSQDGPKMAQDGPEMAQDASKKARSNFIEAMPKA